MNPQNDDLASAWMGGGNNPKPPRHEEEPSVPYTELDDTYYRIVDIYGDQQEAKTRMRRGRKING